MKKLLLMLALLVVGLVPARLLAQDVSGGSIEEIASSVVMIETIRGAWAVSGGTGTIVSEDGLIYTNEHVIEDGNDFAIYLLDEDLGEQPQLRYYASLEYVSEDLDFAILRIDRDERGRTIDPTQEALPYLSPSHEKEVTIGDGIRVFGYPGIGEGYMIVTSGEIVAVQNGNIGGERVPVWYRTDAEIAGGNSGGLAVNDEGEFIGLPTWVLTDDRTAGRLGGILPIGAIKLSLEANPVGGTIRAGGATGGALTIINDSSSEICSAYISPTTASDWGANQLGTDQIPGGASYAFDVETGDYDILLIGCNGNELEDFRDVTVEEQTVFTFSPSGSSFAAGDSPAPQNGDGALLVLENNSNTTICYVYFSLVTETTWGNDQLGSIEVVGNGDTRTWDVEPGRYDVLLQDCEGEDLRELRDVDLTSGEYVITYR